MSVCPRGIPTLDGDTCLGWAVPTLDGSTCLGLGVPTLDGSGYLPWMRSTYPRLVVPTRMGVPTLDGVPTLNGGTYPGGNPPK